MIKKLFVFIALFIAMAGNAQQVGTWKVHPITGSSATNVTATPNNVFFLLADNLYCYDQNEQSVIHYNIQNYLSDSGIKNIYYNYEHHYLFVVYSNCNIDIVTDEGKTYNFPDVKDVVITGSSAAKTVNGVTFCPSANKVYVATSFGIVVIDDKKMEIRESRRYDAAVTGVAQIGDYLIVSTAAGTYFDLASKPNVQLGSMAGFDANLKSAQFYDLNGSQFVAFATNTTLVCKIENGALTKTSVVGATPDCCQTKNDGNVFIPYTSGKYFYVVNKADGSFAKTSYPSAVSGERVSSYDGTYWASGTKGLHHVDASGSTVLMDYLALNGTTLTKIRYMKWNKVNNKLYISASGPCNKWNVNEACTINCYDGEKWENITPSVLSTNKNMSCPILDPELANTYYISGFYTVPIYKVVDNVATAIPQDPKLSAIVKGQIKNMFFDKEKNLWAFDETLGILMLPRANQLSNTFEWKVGAPSGIPGGWKTNLFRASNDVSFFTNNDNGNKIFMFWGDIDNLKFKTFTGADMTNQDGGSISLGAICYMVEDSSKRIWITSSSGVHRFNLNDYSKSSLVLTRPKVPRNDGSGLADFLLEGVYVYDCDFDASGNIWFATAKGLYKTNSEGTAILGEYNSTNTPMPSDAVYSVCYNPVTKTVFIGTDAGVLEYSSSTTPPGGDDEEVVAYPNPVRPDYTGMITITGLKDNTLVNILDAGGGQITSVMSSGGIATWDGCYKNGDRVNTGVYYVAGSNENEGKIYTKILVVK